MVDNTAIIEETGALSQLTKEDKEMLERYGQKLGSALCRVLRHDPDSIGIAMNKQAWVNAGELISRFNARYCNKPFYLSLPVLMEVVRSDNKQRYGLQGKGKDLMIRCRQGHSIPWLEMDYREAVPPDILYHGTIMPYLDSILREGLRPMERQNVHLSWDMGTARKVANRRRKIGDPVILQVNAAQMAADGVTFYLADNDVWLTDYVEPEYIELRQ